MVQKYELIWSCGLIIEQSEMSTEVIDSVQGNKLGINLAKLFAKNNIVIVKQLCTENHSHVKKNMQTQLLIKDMTHPKYLEV